MIDRFSAAAGHLLVRGPGSQLPGPDVAIDFDAGFVTQGLGPDGIPVRYYHLDVQSDVPATVWRFVRAGTRDAVPGQLPVIDVVPGDPGYSDFWRTAWVEVPADFVPGSVTSATQVTAAGLPVVLDDSASNCPVVPPGSQAREGGAQLTERWYRGQRVVCLDFGAAALLLDDAGKVPTSGIFVSFRKNPGQPGGGPPSGFRSEAGSRQTHNVVMSVPGDLDYSPLWAVTIYDSAAFDRVHDEASARAAPVAAQGPLVNCPVVWVQPR